MYLSARLCPGEDSNGENKQEQSSQGAPSFVKVSIPYSKAMILDTPRDYSTTTGTPIPVDRTSEIDSMTLQLLPDEAGSFNGIFKSRFTCATQKYGLGRIFIVFANLIFWTSVGWSPCSFNVIFIDVTKHC